MKYDLKKAALITEIVGGIAILVSLIFVGAQFKENTKATKSATATQTVATMTTWYSSIGNNVESATLFWKFMAQPESFTQEERYPHLMNIHGLWLSFQNSYYLAKEGTLDSRIHDSITAVLNSAKSQPGFQLYWDLRKNTFFEEFRDYVEETLNSDQTKDDGIYKSFDVTDSKNK